jgi:hypothetical protein
MKLVRLKDTVYANVNVIRDISLNEGIVLPEDADPDIFQNFLIVSFKEPVYDKTENVVWIGSRHQQDEAEKLLRFLVDELTEESIPVVDLRPERFNKEFLEKICNE